MKIQMTLFHNTNKYRPVACVIEVKSLEDLNSNFQKYKIQAINKIASQRYKTGTELVGEGYTKLKWRPYKSEDRKAALIEKIMSERGKPNES